MNNWQSVAGQIIQAGAPTIGGILGGPMGGMLGNVLGSLVGQALGVAPTPEAIGAAITADPAGATAKLQPVEAAHAAPMTVLEAQLRDLENARTQTVELARSGSSISWGAPVVSAITTLAFCGMAIYGVVHGIANSDATLQVVGALNLAFGQVIGYWLGSSFGSHQKDATIGALTTRK